MDAAQKLNQFEIQVRQEAIAILPEAVLSVTTRGRYRLKMRIELSQEVFIDIFYNPQNGRTAFSLVHSGQRIFGYDNLGGWHCHPVEAPDTHLPCDEPQPQQVFQEMRDIFAMS